MTKLTGLERLLSRPPYLPQPTPSEIVGAALAKLHADLDPYRTPAGRTALSQYRREGE